MSSRIELLAQGRRAPFFCTPDLASRDHVWAGFSFEEADSPSEPLPRHAWPRTTLLYVTEGQGSLWWKHRGLSSHDAVGPGTVSIMRRDVELQSAVPDGSFRLMVLQLTGGPLQTMAPDQFLAIDRSLTSPQVTQDPHLAALMAAMREEVRGGCASGRLYGESISMALLAYLASRHTPPRSSTGHPKSLSPAQMRNLVSYVRENLDGDISVRDLAALVQMSPSHFARVFKATTGMTPYRFILCERVAGAKELCAATSLPASQVAAEVGFSSHSHLVRVFRAFTGVTPRQYKAGL